MCILTSLYRQIFAEVIVYIFCSIAYDLPNRSRGRIYELKEHFKLKMVKIPIKKKVQQMTFRFF